MQCSIKPSVVMYVLQYCVQCNIVCGVILCLVQYFVQCNIQCRVLQCIVQYCVQCIIWQSVAFVIAQYCVYRVKRSIVQCWVQCSIRVCWSSGYTAVVGIVQYSATCSSGYDLKVVQRNIRYTLLLIIVHHCVQFSVQHNVKCIQS